ncbi:hypothetical protein [Caldimonas tepidiphila]|uniref:Agd3-related carbohydrate deacetylase n=1 Tax=Caldimonas tepidiphila TaxID=2315841 RepID=UPI000E5B5001|nr:hypothetical protein [Caldimonas tepidiphila]
MKHRSHRRPRLFARTALATAAILWTGLACSQVDCLAAGTPVGSIDMKLLVVSANGNEAVLPAIQSTLEYIGIPYDLMIAKDRLLTTDMLCDANDGLGRARYQGVLLATGSLGFDDNGSYLSAFTDEEWNRLWQYEAKYGIRQATLYTYPGGWPDNYGLMQPSALDTTSSPLSTQLTSTSPAGNGDPSGAALFSYLKPAVPLVIRNAYTYLAKPDPNARVTPLLTDAAGNAIALIKNYADGRKNLAVTADGNPHLMHTLSLGYGIVNWVTKGLYVGKRRVLLSAQPDDVMMADDIWDVNALSDATGLTYRITGKDYESFVRWQNNRNATKPGNIVIDIPFNGSGTAANFPKAELYPATTDDLTPAIKKNSAPFNWMSHTYTHLNLDSPVTYSQTLAELRENHWVAINVVKLANYYKDSLITPDVSGLNNPEALRAMSDFGIRYVVSDTSKNCGHRDATPRPCPKPNTGIYNDLQPNILMVPRYPANLFYNVCTPREWVSEYNHIYRGYWGRDLSYQEILDKESDIWLQYLMRYDIRPVMFHQPNMCAYDGTRSLLGDLIDATTDKFNATFNLPVQSRSLRQIGNLMADRMVLNAAFAPASGAPATARLLPGASSSSLVLTNPTAQAVKVPLTGVNWASTSSVVETYGGQTTSNVTVPPNGGVVTVPGAPAW